MAYPGGGWDVEGTEEFTRWFEDLNDEEQISVGRVVELLVEHRAVAAVSIFLGHCDIPTPPHTRAAHPA